MRADSSDPAISVRRIRPSAVCPSNLKRGLICAAILANGSLCAEERAYALVGGGLNLFRHGATDESYLLPGVKAGAGYRISPNLAIEVDAHLRAAGEKVYEGSCATGIATVACTRSDVVDGGYAITLAPLYSMSLLDTDAFVRLGVGYVRSSYRSRLTGPGFEETSTSTASDGYVVLHVGLAKENRHRFGVTASSIYGSANTGEFRFVAFEYDYLFGLN